MSASLLLDALRKHSLQDYYPSLASHGIHKLDSLAQLSDTEYTTLGVRSTDKNRFTQLIKDAKEMLRLNVNRNTKINTRSSIIETNVSPRKRTATATRLSPERKARRMTIAPQIPRTSPAISKQQSMRDRRLSYLPPPRRESMMLNRSPVSPQRKTTLMHKHKNMMTEDVTESKREPLMEQPSARLLDAYGIPVTHRPKTTTTTTIEHGSLEEFMQSRTKTAGSSTAKSIPSSTTAAITGTSELNQRIRVCVRKRPLSKREVANQESDIAPLVGSRTIQLNAPKTRIDLTRYNEKHTFTFDDAFDSNSSNKQIYARTAQPLVEYVFYGGKATCFAHGQTGSGKTYTMLDPEHGLYVLAAQDIFRLLSSDAYGHLSASVGFYEIYQGQLFDLLNKRNKLTARENGMGNVVIAGLREYDINNVEDMMSVFKYGNQGRTTGETGANNKSSRSHAVLQIMLREQDSEKIHGKLSFIDLAGSERGADRGDADVKTRLEGAEINKSLLALKECIRALDQNSTHKPFRGSKLTQVLRDSFTGDSRTCMIATISPNTSNSEHTLNTLRYSDRVKQLRGESDPRLLNDNADPPSLLSLLPTANEHSAIDSKDNLNDSQSVANSDPIWEGEASENLFEVDFPNDVAANALATPTNDRFYSVIPTPTTPQRQEKYLKRLESPPAEVFGSNSNDPFFSKPLHTNDVKTKVESPSPSNHTEFRTNKIELLSPQPAQSKGTLYAARIRRFIRFHRAQIKEVDECLREEKRMIAKLSLTVSSEYDFRNEQDQDDMEDQQCKEEYETYLNDLDDIMDRKATLIAAVSGKIKEELE